ncbi:MULTISPECIES: radical SAM/SPASM domain-containing protein [unclassified Fusibacter]|uniref:radical SAM/SPASM domain-containing protein n=1 Tax=unclassified Fusibacter TaxID=2624464 RepID=UPI0013E92F23|nr:MULTISPECIES: radical SAM/SPASM domain-containing protein [unclassified Fusibacter]MCK8059701.1 radical SAM protein [Fusibacter sp. A2]NPE21502.1 radical SAM protein [Fusibacter sp. A1]
MKTFKRIYIEITNSCNLKCSFCPPSKRESKRMSLAEFEAVLKKIDGHGDFIYLHIKGEPLMHPEFDQVLELCAAYGKKVNLTTNGTLLDVRAQSILKNKAVRQVSVSLQSFEVMENERAYEMYVRKVLDFVARGIVESGIIFELRLWNFEDEKLLVDEVKQKTLMMIEERLGLDEKVTLSAPKGKGIKLLPKVYLSKGYEFKWPDLSVDVIATRGTCYGLRQQVGILSNGDVVPCCLDAEGSVVLGNVFETDFEGIVSSKRALEMITGFENNHLVEELCMRCGYRERFNLNN